VALAAVGVAKDPEEDSDDRCVSPKRAAGSCQLVAHQSALEATLLSVRSSVGRPDEALDDEFIGCRIPGQGCEWPLGRPIQARSPNQLLSTLVTSNDDLFGEADGAGDDPYLGWWVGSDDNWHPPDEAFDSDIPKRTHPVRRMAVVILAIALVGATSVGVWEGASPPTSTTSGPTLEQLTAQVQQEVTGTGPNAFGVVGVSSVVCHLPSSWRAGSPFRCEVDGSSMKELGYFDGTVDSTTVPGQWRWNGVWRPSHSPSVTD
jgi:hypothetical protein